MADLLTTTLKMLGASEQPKRLIAERISVSKRWLYKLADGEIADPGVRRIQRLHDYLAGTRPAGESEVRR